MGAYALAARDTSSIGLWVMPLGGSDGKTPLVKHWAKWRHQPGQAYIAKLAGKFPYANVGMICGPSKVFVVDNDADESVVQSMIRRFGDTPLKIGTPRGGVHLWYHSSGEATGDLRKEGFKVDLKGIGGFVVIPPSIRYKGVVNDPLGGRPYTFLEGSWADLPRLPTIRPGSLSTAAAAPTPLRAIKEGIRDKTLFRKLLREVRHCDNFETLLDVAETINNNALPPLDAAEVKKTAASAWDLEVRGKNWVGKEAKVDFYMTEFERLTQHEYGSDGMMLAAKLRFAHGDREEFAASPKRCGLSA